MNLLLIETSLEKGLLAYVNQTTIAERELPFVLGQSRELMHSLSALLPATAHATLQGIAVGIGPGSYTGIRLGVSVAQALSYAWQIPLVGLSSLNGFIPRDRQSPFAVLLDARRGGVYAVKRAYTAGEIADLDPPTLISLSQLDSYLTDIDYIISPHAEMLQHKLATYSTRNWIWEQGALSARAFSQAAHSAFAKGQSTIGKCPPLLYLQLTEAEKKAS